MQEWPVEVDAFLEKERIRRPLAVEALRCQLGLDPDPWMALVSDAIAVYERSMAQEERILLAAALLRQEGSELTGALIAVCHHPAGLPLLTSMHAVAPRGPLRRYLAGHLARRGRHEELKPAEFRLNRESPAFHDGFLDGPLLVMVYREYPGVYTLFCSRLGEGVEDLVVVPVPSEAALCNVLSLRHSRGRERVGLDECRAHLAAAITRLGEGVPSASWEALGHLVEERLFPDVGRAGFVVGERSARLVLDRLASVALGQDERALLDLVRPASPAEVALELFGAPFLHQLFGVGQGVCQLDIGIEQEGETGGLGVITGRDGSGNVLTRTRLHLSRTGEDWWVDRFALCGVGEEGRVLRPVMESLHGRMMLPVLDFDGLPAAEQEIIAALLDLEFGLDEISRAVSMGRELQLTGSPGSVAAVCHFLFVTGEGRQVLLEELIERYSADAAEVEAILDRSWRVLKGS